MERQMSQTSQWSKTCIGERAYRWKDKCLKQVNGVRLVSGREVCAGKNEYSNQVSEIKLVSGRELTDGKMSEATGSVK